MELLDLEIKEVSNKLNFQIATTPTILAEVIHLADNRYACRFVNDIMFLFPTETINKTTKMMAIDYIQDTYIENMLLFLKLTVKPPKIKLNVKKISRV